MPRARLAILIFALTLFAPSDARSQTSVSDAKPLRVAMAGLTHGHASGLLQHIKNRHDVELVGIAEPDKTLFDRYAKDYNLDPKLYHAELDELLTATHPQAVLIYTTTFGHRQAVEICARHKTPAMMEKPLAVSNEAAQAIAAAAHAANIPVVVNYETTWYRSNRAAFDLVHEHKIGEIRKVVVHDGHPGPQKIHVQPEFFAWLNDPKLNGAGALFDFGCYGADLMTWLMDNTEPNSVTGITQHFQPDIYTQVDDEGTIVVTYPHAQAIFQASWNWPFDRKDLEVYGATGYAITVKRDDIRVRLPNSEEELVAAKPIPPPYDDSIDYLRAVVIDGMKPDGPSSLETNLVVTEILDAARASASSGKRVRAGIYMEADLRPTTPASH
jgi:glucose-fructose oxidoreductase